MNKALRKTIIAGNWKMNKTRSEAAALLEQIKAVAIPDGVEVVVCVPFTNLETAVNAVKGTGIKIGSQNVHFAENGAYTGEVSAAMLKELGVEYAIIGHSERRQYFGETDSTVNLRTKAALNAGLVPILCVGELLEEREADITEEVVSRQTKLGLAGLSADEVKKTVIAYEPVWAIGTGKVATAEQACEACGVVRNVIAKLYGGDVAQSVTVQYGGSMNAGNAAELLARVNVDGGLIGGASLDADGFGAIIKAAGV